MPALSKTRTVLNIVGDPSEIFGVNFESRDEDNLEHWRFMGVDHGIWGELGKPDVVTVSVEPGDLLNVD